MIIKRCTLFILYVVCVTTSARSFAFRTLTEAREAGLREVSKVGTKLSKQEADLFKKDLAQLVEQRENTGFTGRSIIKITPYPETRFVIWGPLKGGFQSLLRALTYLEKQKILDNTFKLTTPRVYIIFNGDVIEDSPYAFDTLKMVLALIKSNPNKIFYLRGINEDLLNWQTKEFKRSLETNFRKGSAEKVPLNRLLTRFFNTLPLALYLGGKNPSDGLIRISYFPINYPGLDERSCASFLSTMTVNVPEICLLSDQHKGSPVGLKALIKSENRLVTYKNHPGLTLVEPDRGAVAWSIFSGVTAKYKEDYQFVYDAFSIIEAGNSLKEATISLYNRDIRGDDDFTRVVTYNLLTGQRQAVKQVSKKEAAVSELQAKLEAAHQRISSLSARIEEYKKAVQAYKPKGVVS